MSCTINRTVRIIAAFVPLLAADVMASHRSASTLSDVPNGEGSASRLTLKVTSDLVQIPVTVTDKSGRVVETLTKENFVILENGVEQTVAHFALDEAPMSVCLVVDTSLSMAAKLDKSVAAVNEFLSTSKPDDEFCLVRFSDSVDILVTLTKGPSQIIEAMHTIHAHGFTALMDGIGSGIEEVQKGQNRHKAVIVISDGGDNRSLRTQKQIRRLVRDTDVQIHSIGILVPESDMFSQAEVDGPSLLKRISRDSGGEPLLIKEITDLSAAIAKITMALRHQYILGYYPKEIRNDGKYRRVTVRLQPPRGTPSLRASWRAGYYAPQR
jgi:VWFA-related protein